MLVSEFVERWNMSQSDLARLLDVRQSTVSDWLNEKRTPPETISMLLTFWDCEFTKWTQHPERYAVAWSLIHR